MKVNDEIHPIEKMINYFKYYRNSFNFKKLDMGEQIKFVFEEEFRDNFYVNGVKLDLDNLPRGFSYHYDEKMKCYCVKVTYLMWYEELDSNGNKNES